MTSPFLLRVLGRSGHASMPCDRRQRARQGGAARSSGSARFTVEPQLDPGGRGVLPGAARRACRAPADALAAAQGRSPLAGELVEPLLGMTVVADDGARVREAQRDPGGVRDHDRRAAPARPVAGGSRGGAPRVPRRGRLRARQPRRGTAARARRSAGRCGTPPSRSSPTRSPAPRSRRSASPASPTRTGCATRSARSRTGSSRRARWTPRSRRG